MATAPTADSDRLIETLRGTIVGMIQRDTDLTARQLGVFLTCYRENEPQTVRGLAVELNIVKQAVTRALNRLEENGLVRRRIDPQDRRSVLVMRTVAGQAFVLELKQLMVQVAREAERTTAWSE